MPCTEVVRFCPQPAETTVPRRCSSIARITAFVQQLDSRRKAYKDRARFSYADQVVMLSLISSLRGYRDHLVMLFPAAGRRNSDRMVILSTVSAQTPLCVQTRMCSTHRHRAPCTLTLLRTGDTDAVSQGRGGGALLASTRESENRESQIACPPRGEPDFRKCRLRRAPGGAERLRRRPAVAGRASAGAPNGSEGSKGPSGAAEKKRARARGGRHRRSAVLRGPERSVCDLGLPWRGLKVAEFCRGGGNGG